MSFTPEQLARVQKLMDVVDKRSEDIKKLTGTAYDDAQRELEVAVAKVASLMQKYSINNEDIRRKSSTQPVDEKIVDWYFNLDTKGGHGRSRVESVTNVIHAMGGKSAYVSNSYDCYVVVTAPVSVIENMKIFFPMMLLQMETLANRFSRNEAKQYRETYGRSIDPKKSLLNRRGFMQGFGRGVANRITMAQREDMTEDYAKNGESGGYALVVMTRKQRVEAAYRVANPTFYDAEGKLTAKSGVNQQFSRDAFRSGRAAGQAFASPKIGGSRPAVSS